MWSPGCACAYAIVGFQVVTFSLARADSRVMDERGVWAQCTLPKRALPVRDCGQEITSPGTASGTWIPTRKGSRLKSPGIKAAAAARRTV